MKQDRFLVGILIGIAVLIVVALGVFFTRKDSLVYVDDSSPAGVVQNYVVSLHKKDYEKAYGYLADLPNKPSFEQFRQSFMGYINPQGTGLQIGDAEISSDVATVTLEVIYTPGDPFSSGYRNVEYSYLLLQNGNWKIKQMPYNFWAYDWYQPTPIPVK